MIEESMSAGRTFPRALTIVILLAVLVTQLWAFSPSHSDEHSKHCCPACHASHAPVLAAAVLVALSPPSFRTYWQLAPDSLPSLLDAWSSGACTRGPPTFITAA
jgi:hypothetical protein